VRLISRGCGATDDAGHVCKREAGHPGVHEHYENGQTLSWANESGWLIRPWMDEDGPFWRAIRYRGTLGGGGFDDDGRKYDAPSSAEAACESLNRRGGS
jgi:hypothetical protein